MCAFSRTSRAAEVISVDAGIDAGSLRTKVVDKVKEEVEGIKLEDASIIVSGGRGIGNADNRPVNIDFIIPG